MPITAFSTVFAEELDVQQLLHRFGYDSSADGGFTEIPMEIRSAVAASVQCPSCGVGNAIIVGPAKSRKSGLAVGQPHFRFTSTTSENAHDSLCDFYEEKGSAQPAHLVDFRKDQSTQTQYVRELVCRGIEQRVFSQATIRAMRQWFLESKRAHMFVMNVDETLLRWCHDLYRINSYLDAYPFHPSHGDLPNFDWKSAASGRFAKMYEDLVKECRDINFRVWFHAQDLPALVALVKRHDDQNVFDVTSLEGHYKASIEVAKFITRHLNGPAKHKVYVYPTLGKGKVLASLLAFSALLLFVSAWSVDEAISLFVRLASSSPAQNINAGNVIGLNPFHEYEAWSHILIARKIATQRMNDRSIEQQIDAIELELRNEHHAWRLAQASLSSRA